MWPTQNFMLRELSIDENLCPLRKDGRGANCRSEKTWQERVRLTGHKRFARVARQNRARLWRTHSRRRRRARRAEARRSL